jgi:KDO2-lipid IV(A) lauroyltransferase
MARAARSPRTALIGLADAAAGHTAAGLLRVLRLFPRQGSANAVAAAARAIGPLLKEHRIGRDNLKAAFPEKSDAEIETILKGVWDNLGRVVGEFAHIDRIRTTIDPDARHGDPGDVDFSADTERLFRQLQDDGKPALIFAAHLANWELPAQIARTFGLDTAVLYRRPNLGAVADAITRIRSGSMGSLIATGLDAPVRLAEALAAGRHVAMLVDQYYVRGVEVTFFGQRTRANPLIARLARQVDCPIHGTRIVRLPGGRFRAELTEAIPPVRDADGRVDIAGTMQAITTVIEGWIREHPEQWLWLHRRWRPQDAPFRR